jgi:hypothetical protein
VKIAGISITYIVSMLIGLLLLTTLVSEFQTIQDSAKATNELSKIVSKKQLDTNFSRFNNKVVNGNNLFSAIREFANTPNFTIYATYTKCGVPGISGCNRYSYGYLANSTNNVCRSIDFYTGKYTTDNTWKYNEVPASSVGYAFTNGTCYGSSEYLKLPVGSSLSYVYPQMAMKTTIIKSEIGTVTGILFTQINKTTYNQFTS